MIEDWMLDDRGTTTIKDPKNQSKLVQKNDKTIHLYYRKHSMVHIY